MEDNYLVDQETLGKFVDEIMKGKTFPDKTPEEISSLRLEGMKKLDDKISKAIFDKLNDQQLNELKQILDNGDESPEVFQNFFTNTGLDLENIISSAMYDFRTEFLGGQNE